MASVIGKRKREENHTAATKVKKAVANGGNKLRLESSRLIKQNGTAPNPAFDLDARESLPKRENGVVSNTTIQIVTGSYERILHGVTADIPHGALRAALESLTEPDGAEQDDREKQDEVVFADAFLFTAHSSAIRCLAISPAAEESSKRILATGGSDERINLFTLSSTPPSLVSKHATALSAVAPSNSVSAPSQDTRNRPLGALLHHDRPVTQLSFPTKSKLFSSSEDSTIAITRVRDWTLLSAIKAPIPALHGRPAGDTAASVADTPSGVSAFAVHPSQRLMLSVGRRDRALRLWNLLTGKKAGVLNFPRDVLGRVGERHVPPSVGGEGRSLLWTADGETYAVGFEKGAVLFGLDSRPKAIMTASPPTKIHQMRAVLGSGGRELFAVSTEDGRVLFYDVDVQVDGFQDDPSVDAKALPACRCVAQLAGIKAGLTGRIKDFEILQLPAGSDLETPVLLVVTGSSDGAIRLWVVSEQNLFSWKDFKSHGANGTGENSKGDAAHSRQIGSLIGTLETGNRITCLGSFPMNGKADSGDGDSRLDKAEDDEDDDEDGESD